jgi:RimJ/RimL family protein N-acetyltransferase
MPGITIRPAVAADADAIALVHVLSWQAAYRGLLPQDYLDRLDPAPRAERWRQVLAEAGPARGGVLVAGDEAAPGDPRIVGFAGYQPTRDTDADPAVTGQLSTIYLVPEVWGTGTGRRLLAGAVAGLAAAGYADATLWVLDGNQRACRFYAAAGWAPDGTHQDDTRPGFTLHELRYRRTL